MNAADPLALLNGRAKNLDRSKFAYSLEGDGGFGMDVVITAEPEVNEAEMSFTLPFADGRRRDGVGDLLEVGGIDCERHRKNPVALFDHGKQHTLPIGKCEDPKTGAYTVEIDPVSKVARAKVFVYQDADNDHAVFCEQLFDLWRKKFIRGGSIGYQVKSARELPPDYETGTPKGLHLLATLMLECSMVVMPANQDTVKGLRSVGDLANEILALPKVCGKALSPVLVKSLATYAAPRKAQVAVPLNQDLTPTDVPPAKWKPGVGAECKELDDYPAVRTKDAIPGGLAEGRSLEDFDPEQLEAGVKVELEHSGGVALAREIAMDHLTEDPDYYRKLAKMEGTKAQPSDDITPEKARQILKDGEVHGHPLTEKQRGMFGAAAGKEKAIGLDDAAILGLISAGGVAVTYLLKQVMRWYHNIDEEEFWSRLYKLQDQGVISVHDGQVSKLDPPPHGKSIKALRSKYGRKHWQVVQESDGWWVRGYGEPQDDRGPFMSKTEALHELAALHGYHGIPGGIYQTEQQYENAHKGWNDRPEDMPWFVVKADERTLYAGPDQETAHRIAHEARRSGRYQGVTLADRGGRPVRVKGQKSLDLASVRKKYRSAKGLRRRLKKSSPGAGMVHVDAKDLEAARKFAEGRGLKFAHLASSGGLAKVKLIGDDEGIDAVAKEFGRRRFKALTKSAPVTPAASEGVAARLSNAARTDNPYPPGGEDWAAWDGGWQMAGKGIKGLAGKRKFINPAAEKVFKQYVYGMITRAQAMTKLCNEAGMTPQQAEAEMAETDAAMRGNKGAKGQKGVIRNAVHGVMRAVGMANKFPIGARVTITPKGRARIRSQEGRECPAEGRVTHSNDAANWHAVQWGPNSMDDWANFRGDELEVKSMPAGGQKDMRDVGGPSQLDLPREIRRNLESNGFQLNYAKPAPHGGFYLYLAPGSDLGRAAQILGRVRSRPQGDGSLWVDVQPGKSISKNLNAEGRKHMARNLNGRTKALDDQEDVLEDQVKDLSNQDDWPYGLQVAHRIIEDHKQLLQDYDELNSPYLEHEHTRKALQKQLEGIAGGLDEWEAHVQKHYPDYAQHVIGDTGAKDMTEEEAGEVEGELDAMSDELEDVSDDVGEEFDDTEESKDMDTMDDDGQFTDSAPDEGPSPEEALEGTSKRLRNGRTKTLRVARRKSACPCGKEPCECDDKGLRRRTKDAPQTDPLGAPDSKAEPELEEPDMVVNDSPTIGEAKDLDLDDRERGLVGEASGHAKSLAGMEQLDEEARFKSYHYHKALEGMAQIQDVNEELNGQGKGEFAGDLGWLAEEGAEAEHGKGLKGKAKGVGDDGMQPGNTDELDAGLPPPAPPAPDAPKSMHPHRQACKDASVFFGDAARTKDWGEQHRQDAQMVAKALDEITAAGPADKTPPPPEEEGFDVGEMGEKSRKKSHGWHKSADDEEDEKAKAIARKALIEQQKQVKALRQMLNGISNLTR